MAMVTSLIPAQMRDSERAQEFLSDKSVASPAPVFQCAILCTAGIVNDETLKLCFKTVGIELFEAEFNINLFLLGKLNSFDQTE